MDLERTNILLGKINSLFRNMNADAKNISNIEKDLLKSYVQQLYETLLDAPESASPKREESPVETFKSKPKVTLNKPAPVSVVKLQTPSPQAEDLPEEVEMEVAQAARPANMKEPVTKKVTPPVPPVISTKPAAPSPIPVPLPNTKVSPGLEELFTFGSAKELSEKLSQLPITDIRKAMGLNERIFTVNELFGGKQPAFDDTLKALNQLKSFEEAKQYLIQNAAKQFDWSAKDRKNKAKTFIKLVKRRYN